MTNTTTSGAADLPEALRSIQRFEVVDCIDDKHVPAVIPNPHGPWVRYEDHIAALASAPAQPAGMTDDEKHLRRMLCVAHAGALAYMDDGEASDSRMHPTIDFLRDSPKDIQRKIWERNRAAFTAAPAQPVAHQAMAYASLPDMDDTLWLAIGQHRRAITTVETSAAACAGACPWDARRALPGMDAASSLNWAALICFAACNCALSDSTSSRAAAYPARRVSFSAWMRLKSTARTIRG